MRLAPLPTISERLAREISPCVKCGNCSAFCPVFLETRREEGSMRGKIALHQARIAGRQIPDRVVRDAFSLCAGSLSCKGACPNGIDTTLVRALSARLTAPFQAGFLPDSFFDKIAANPSLLWIWTGLRFFLIFGVGFDKVKEFRKWFLESFPSLAPRKEPGIPAQDGEKTVFIPGWGSRHGESLGRKALALLGNPGGTSVIALPAHRCGFPALTLGDFGLYRAFISRIVNDLERIQPSCLVVACAKCLWSLKIAPVFCELSDRELGLLEKAADFASFVSKRGPGFTKPLPGTFTLLDSNLHSREFGGKRSCRELLGRALANPLVESFKDGRGALENDLLRFHHPALARKIDSDLVEMLATSGARTVIFADPSSLERLKGPLSKRGVLSAHFVEILFEALGGGNG